MNKKLISILLVIILCFALIPAVLADNSKSVVYDQEGLLDDDEVNIINTKLSELLNTYEIDVTIVTTSSFDGLTAQEYADNFYELNDIGQGNYKDGILLLISSAERQYAITTTGYCIYVFTDDNLEHMSDNFISYMSNGEWFDACLSFINDCGTYLTSAEDDNYQYNPDDFDNDYDSNYNLVSTGSYFNISWLIIALIIGLIIAAISMLILKSGMKSVSMQTSASNYVRAGSFKPGRQQDMFLYHTVIVTARPKSDDNNSGGHHGGFGAGGGFSNTHVSRGGSTHGGRSGSF